MTEWNVRLQFGDVRIPEPVDRTLDELLGLLETFGPVATLEPDRLSLYLSVEGRSPQPALKSAQAAAQNAMRRTEITSGRTPVGVEIYTDEELDRRNGEPMYPEVVGVAEIAGMLSVSKQRVSELARSRRFPDPLYELAGGPIWIRGAIEAFVKTWERKPGRPRKAAAG